LVVSPVPVDVRPLNGIAPTNITEVILGDDFGDDFRPE
jgi:hypothetical protein